MIGTGEEHPRHRGAELFGQGWNVLDNEFGAPLSGRRVLVVEDEFIIALDVQRMMEEAGASEVTVAYSIEEARDLLAKGIHFDMGVVDLKLGGQDARPLIGELRDRNIPLIVATGFDAGLEIEDTVVISKPYSDETVLSAIRELLSRSGK